MHKPERTVSTSVVVVWILWAIAVVVCLVCGVVVLTVGEHIWARSLGIFLLAVELLAVAGAAIATARLLLRRHARRQADFIIDAVMVKNMKDVRDLRDADRDI